MDWTERMFWNVDVEVECPRCGLRFVRAIVTGYYTDAVDRLFVLEDIKLLHDDFDIDKANESDKMRAYADRREGKDG
jgi:hypothetical protein